MQRPNAVVDTMAERGKHSSGSIQMCVSAEKCMYYLVCVWGGGGRRVLHNFHIKNPAALLHSPPYAGVNVVFDPVGGSALFESLKCVAWGAHYLVIGFAAGDIPKVRVAAFGVGV